MNNNNENNNNYVTPESVDLTKVQVDQTNKGALNRERDNIISATIQANNAINEREAKVVNNTIKVKKRNPFLNLLVGLVAISIAGGGAYLAYHFMSEYNKKEDAKTSTTIKTTTEVNYVKDYTLDMKKCRKYQNDKEILILIPHIENVSDTYLYLVKSENGLINKETGTYTIENDSINLVGNNGKVTYKITKEDISNEDTSLKMYDSEMKYYMNSYGILIINATLKNEIAYYLTSTESNYYTFTESIDEITLENGANFKKVEDRVEYNGSSYELGK